MTEHAYFQPVDVDSTNDRQHRRQIATALNRTIKGKLNATASITLQHGATSTVVTDSRISLFSWIGLMPQTADAFAIQSSVWPSSIGKGTVTFTHPSTANTDQNFLMVIIG